MQKEWQHTDLRELGKVGVCCLLFLFLTGCWGSRKICSSDDRCNEVRKLRYQGGDITYKVKQGYGTRTLPNRTWYIVDGKVIDKEEKASLIVAQK